MTESSREPAPLDGALAEALREAPKQACCWRCEKPLQAGTIEPRRGTCEPCFEALIAQDRAQKAISRARQFVEKANVPFGCRSMSFETWRSEVGTIPTKVEDWVRTESNLRSNLVICSPYVGIGKTHLAVAAARLLWEEGEESIRYIDCPTLNSDLVHDVKDGTTTTLDNLARPRWLVLDDFGKGHNSVYLMSVLSGVLHRRHAQGKHVIMTTNLDPRRLYRDGYDGKDGEPKIPADPATWSRVLAGARIVLPGDLPRSDFRIRFGINPQAPPKETAS